jgi:hypothetical protein
VIREHFEPHDLLFSAVSFFHVACWQRNVVNDAKIDSLQAAFRGRNFVELKLAARTGVEPVHQP